MDCQIRFKESETLIPPAICNMKTLFHKILFAVCHLHLFSKKVTHKRTLRSSLHLNSHSSNRRILSALHVPHCSALETLKPDHLMETKQSPASVDLTFTVQIGASYHGAGKSMESRACEIAVSEKSSSWRRPRLPIENSTREIGRPDKIRWWTNCRYAKQSRQSPLTYL